ncbi:hypothetical protein BN1723_006580 [Verticillium longisporum]|uniref:Uncharacterized protein n=1 Tax=Verticillium longisporum TaxID=100787 RepID=A0A0G4NG06_VERLO|nr:hypothetical protein HYQ44_003485 [Verticillium longisporum]KAG7147252.1 hypothetical protein HYQ46_003916 [Verticillium longisporum]CRK06995.1 hypothetical protein BN1708_009758 [Verticillium longisporum]CRK45353.1 hypothetical protein BN1723_006580 [Verticillium longisporum]
MHYLYSTFAVAIMLAGGALADLHKVAVCVTNRKSAPIGGTGWSASYNWAKNYEILPEATRCACNLYRQRKTGNKQWDKCRDCTFDGLGCNSAGWHIGGDEMNYYCSKKCGAQGSEAN